MMHFHENSAISHSVILKINIQTFRLDITNCMDNIKDKREYLNINLLNIWMLINVFFFF